MTAATSVRARTVGPWSSRDPIPSLDDRRDRGHGRPSRPRPQASALALSVPGAAAPRSIRSRTVASHCPCPHATLANPRPHPRAAVTSHCPRGLRCGNGRLQRRVGGPCCHGHHSASSRTHPGNHNSTEGGHGNILDGATKVDIHAWDAIREHRHLPSLSGCLSGACGGGRDCSCCNGGRWYPHGGPAVTVRPPRPLRPSSLARSHSRHSRSIDARSILV
ncbi:hypothetical protein SORBI_3007G013700 [Sorghum bicolor]|uniref:Uncharacterized protein n=1 Tax=Sorghum bicolor TaxID=4558 RepID=A0A1B6PF47_SORBI|nr:hypothetical protein SORBI_3007G013700 [Sorghum bicolor]